MDQQSGSTAWLIAAFLTVAVALTLGSQPELVQNLLNAGIQLWYVLAALSWFLWIPFLEFVLSRAHRAERRAEWRERPAAYIFAELIYIFLPPAFFWGLMVLCLNIRP